MKCRQCGKELKPHWSTDICLECSRRNVKKIFRENPEVNRHSVRLLKNLKSLKMLRKWLKIQPIL